MGAQGNRAGQKGGVGARDHTLDVVAPVPLKVAQDLMIPLDKATGPWQENGQAQVVDDRISTVWQARGIAPRQCHNLREYERMRGTGVLGTLGLGAVEAGLCPQGSRACCHPQGVAHQPY